MISYKNRIKKTKTSSYSFLPYNTTSSLALTMVYGRTNYMKYDDSFPKSIFLKHLLTSYAHCGSLIINPCENQA